MRENPLFNFSTKSFITSFSKPLILLYKKLPYPPTKEGLTGDDRFTPHGFRRMVVGDLARSGVDVKTAAKLMGHTIEVMLCYYHDVTEQDLTDAVLKAKLGVLDVPTEKGQVISGPWPAGGGDAEDR